MEFINFNHVLCDMCFKCLRICPTKAISFTEHKRKIIDDICIKCGLCQNHCKQGALKAHRDIDRVKVAIKSGKKVVASIAPSFAGAFEMKNLGQMATALKQIGFSCAEETAHGAEIVSLHYEKAIQNSNSKNIVTSCCPSSNYLIEHYYPKALQQVIPVMSPMLAHGIDMKRRYGAETYCVFIGPCLAKKAEALEIPKAIDAVITFVELEEWLKESQIELSDLATSAFDSPSGKRGRAYPLGGSLWRNDLKTRISSNYEYIHVEGIEACKTFLSAVEEDEITGFCAELNICQGSCLNGPEMPLQAPSLYKRRSKLSGCIAQTESFTSNEELAFDEAMLSIDISRTFESKLVAHGLVNEGQVASVLMEMEKYSEKDQIDCGACGYQTCYDKAVAVTKGYSDINMCLERLKHKAESLQGIIFENSPNAICILDDSFSIQDVNPAFHSIFNEERIKLKGWPISAIIGHEIFAELKNTPIGGTSRKIYLEQVERSFYSNVVKLNEGKIYVVILTDISEAENNRLELLRVKGETLKTCQEVIENQMRVAQQIASLLGETTAETKIGLNQLKKLVLSEGEV